MHQHDRADRLRPGAIALAGEHADLAEHAAWLEELDHLVPPSDR